MRRPALASFVPTLPVLPLRVRSLLALTPSEPRVVIVTGASSGIGRATALRAAAEQDHLVLVARRQGVLDEVASECIGEGASSALVVVADVSQDDQVAELFEKAVAEHGRIDAVLHCAGVVAYGRTEEVSAETFDQVVSTNLIGSVNVARHSIRAFRRQERGVLVLVGSLLGHVAVPDMTPYVVSKWAVRALARQLKIENNDLRGIHICHVSPGAVDTPIYDNPLESAGMVNEPPPPTISPERVARVIRDQMIAPHSSAQTAWANYGMVAAFNIVPGIYDRFVGPVFDAVSRRESAPAES